MAKFSKVKADNKIALMAMMGMKRSMKNRRQEMIRVSSAQNSCSRNMADGRDVKKSCLNEK